jgi:hypothetical protein
MGGHLRILSCLALVGGLATSAMALAPAASAAATHHRVSVCTGTPKTPGVLTGRHRFDVVVKGACEVNAGRAFVGGDLTLRPGAVLIAAFGLNDRTGKGSSSLTVAGDLRVGAGAAMVLGCDPSSFPCLDDPNQNAPTLSSHDRIFGDLTATRALGVVVHNVSVRDDVRQRGGGGGVTCTPSGIFAQFQSPVYSAYEDSSVGGTISVSGVRSCWMGLIRLHVRENMVVRNNKLADPDAIEINANHIADDLSCRGNSMVWDSADIGPNLFPRQPQPNTVGGERHGQCVLNSPTSPQDSPGPGPF